jgi:hypothetical protein
MKSENTLRDYELMDRIIEAQRNNRDFVEFKHGRNNIKIKIKKVYSEGIMRGNKGYYSE